ncbi:MAG: NUDIX hydrolase [Gammaproteobacteria bacterium]
MRVSPAAPEPSRKPAPQSETSVDRVRCVLMRDQRYLLAQHNSRRRENRSRWGLVGGRVRDREDLQDCLRRELNEELDCQVPYLIELGDWQHRDETHRIFGCEIARSIETFNTDELSAIAWFTLAEVAQLAAAERLRIGFEFAAITAFERRRTLSRE